MSVVDSEEFRSMLRSQIASKKHREATEEDNHVINITIDVMQKIGITKLDKSGFLKLITYQKKINKEVEKILAKEKEENEQPKQ
jgi:hypothetical protein